MTIEEEIRKRAEEYATSLKIDKNWAMSLGSITTDGDGNLVTLESVFIIAATEFYEKGRYELLKQLLEICDEKRIQRHLPAFSLYEIEALIKSPQTKQKGGEG